MDYARIYAEFIADRLEKQPAIFVGKRYKSRHKYNKKVNGVFEHHHIKPDAFGGTDDADNIVSLTPGDHYFAHLVLAKIHGGKMWVPLLRMSRLPQRIKMVAISRSSRFGYELAKKKNAQFQREKRIGTHQAGFVVQWANQENKTVYPWENINTGETVQCTLRELGKLTGIATNKLSEVANRSLKSRNGWKLQGTSIETAREKTIRTAREPRTWFINLNTGEEVFSSPVLMAEKYGLKSAAFNHVERGNSSSFGWIKKGSVITSGKYKTTSHYKAKSIICQDNGTRFESVSAASQWAKCDRRLISAALAGKQNSAGGFRWAYA